MTRDTAGMVEAIQLASVAPGGTNPRKNFDPAGMAELTDSVKRHGVLQPVLVRPWPERKAPRGAVVARSGGYELVAGERRWRAAKAAGLAEIPALVRDLSDAEVLEIQVVENLTRQDLHPLEEADGYRQLRAAGYDVSRIAERVGRSVAYIYDRLRLANLNDEARTLFADGKITAGHAVVLARLTPEQQDAAITTPRALFDSEHLLWDPRGPEEGPDDERRKPMSVRELQAWIDQHCKLDVHQADLDQLFPEVAAAVAPPAPEVEPGKVVQITHEHYVQPTARDGSRIIGPRSWKRAEKPCEHQATGVIVVGPGRGEAFPVCVEKKRCTVHWGTEIRAAKKAAKEREAVATGDDKAAKGASRAKAEDPWEATQRRVEEKRKKWEQAAPAILGAVARELLDTPHPEKGPIANLLLAECGGWDDRRSGDAERYVPKDTPEDLLRHLALMVLASEGAEYNAHVAFPKRVKELFGLDLKPILKAAEKTAPAAEPEQKPAKKAKRS